MDGCVERDVVMTPAVQSSFEEQAQMNIVVEHLIPNHWNLNLRHKLLANKPWFNFARCSVG